MCLCVCLWVCVFVCFVCVCGYVCINLRLKLCGKFGWFPYTNIICVLQIDMNFETIEEVTRKWLQENKEFQLIMADESESLLQFSSSCPRFSSFHVSCPTTARPYWVSEGMRCKGANIYRDLISRTASYKSQTGELLICKLNSANLCIKREPR